jgi:hypothetical protein
VRRIPIAIVLLLGVGWSVLALWFDGPASRPLAGALAALFALTCAGAAVRLRPFRRAALAVAVAIGLVVAWWLSIPPRNDRDWMPDVARLPHARVDGDRITIENVRDFHYRSENDFDVRWETRTWDLSKLRGVDLYLSSWGSPYIVHTIMSWEFADAPPLAISIETRKERGESYSAVRGFFRQYELYYVVADERDVVALRTNQRGERVWLYRLHTSPELARAVLLDYLREIDALAEHPRWYNALTHNCTTTIRYHVREVAPTRPLSWKLLVNGYLDQLAYERGTVDTSLPFDELRAESEITERARAIGDAPDFSARIRAGLPGREGGWR